MKINSTKETLLEAVQIIQASLSSRTTLPILHNFLMEAEGSKIKLVRTDLEMATTHYIDADIEEPGSITVPAKEFSDILHTLSGDQEVVIYTDKSNKVYLNSGKSKFWVMGTPKEEYPLVPDMDKSEIFKIPASVIQKMITRTIFAASTQETRYVLNGVLWIKTKEKFEMVATDGRRLAVSSHRGIANTKEFKIIVPVKILQEILRFLGINKPEAGEEMSIGVSQNQIGFQMRNTTFISRLIEGNFPNYEQVIPTKKDVFFEMDSKELFLVTKRAALCTSDRGGAVKYQMKDGVLFINAASQKMEFNDEIKTAYKGQDFQMAFNPQYITDVLKNMDGDKVVFGMTTAVNPVVMEPVGEADCKYVIMPVRS